MEQSFEDKIDAAEELYERQKKEHHKLDLTYVVWLLLILVDMLAVLKYAVVGDRDAAENAAVPQPVMYYPVYPFQGMGVLVASADGIEVWDSAFTKKIATVETKAHNANPASISLVEFGHDSVGFCLAPNQERKGIVKVITGNKNFKLQYGYVKADDAAKSNITHWTDLLPRQNEVFFVSSNAADYRFYESPDGKEVQLELPDYQGSDYLYRECVKREKDFDMVSTGVSRGDWLQVDVVWPHFDGPLYDASGSRRAEVQSTEGRTKRVWVRFVDAQGVPLVWFHSMR